MPRLQVRTKARSQQYEIRIGSGLLQAVGGLCRERLGADARRVVLISDRKVFSLYGTAIIKGLRAVGFAVSQCSLPEGERYKSIRTLEKTLHFLNEIGIERSDAVIALGGGVVGDVAGFAAAVYLRGVRFIQIPTTLLAQIDSSVGGKTGVNLPAGKNLVGAFHQPSLVVVDVETLNSLPARELVAGWCECVKQGAVSGRELLDKTTGFLEVIGKRAPLISPRLERLIASHCAFKASIVADDERENVTRADSHSRRILNFGHTVAHALESVTHYRRFRHGEAVGHGMLVAGELSKNLGLLHQTELELLNKAVRLCGPLPAVTDLDDSMIAGAIAQDKKRVAGHVKWVLLERIGTPRIIDGSEISSTLLRKSVRAVFQKRNSRH